MMLTADGLDKAIIGIGERCGDENIVAYDCEKIIKILMKRDGMTEEEALEFLSFNITGAYMGEGTPIFIWKMGIKEINEVADQENE